jgi:hypothetical protein
MQKEEERSLISRADFDCSIQVEVHILQLREEKNNQSASQTVLKKKIEHVQLHSYKACNIIQIYPT